MSDPCIMENYPWARDMIPAAVALVAFTLLVMPAMAVGTYTWDPGDPNYDAGAAVIPGIFDYTTGAVPGDYIGTAPGTYSNGYGSSGADVGWDDTYIIGIGNADTNGDAWDGLWVQPDIARGQYGWWDLKKEYSGVVVSTSQDHGPYLAEGLEYRIRGCSQAFDDASCHFEDAMVMGVYPDGWRVFNPAEDINGNGWSSDDITALYYLGGTYRYVRLEGWDISGGLNEPEVDALGGTTGPQPIPEFPTLAVPAAFVAGIILVARLLGKREA